MLLAQSTVEKILDAATQRGAQFAEVFVEESVAGSIDLLDQRIDRVTSGVTFGVGIRLVQDGEVFYAHSSDAAEAVLLELAMTLARAGKAGQPALPLARQPVADRHLVMEDPFKVAKTDKAALLRLLDEGVRGNSPAVRQVSAALSEKRRSILVANSQGLLAQDQRSHARIRLGVIAEEGDGPQSVSEAPGVLGGYEFFRGLDIDAMAQDLARRASVMARAGYIEGGSLPVVLGNGFGGVIFHEACGHPLETEAIRKGASPFEGKLGQRVAQNVLTAIDDGTLANRWGSSNIDDEGMETQRTVLIENGILKSYLADRLGAEKTGQPRTGSGRRESYQYAPVSRMRNTYIAPGPNTVEEMIGSIDLGLYAKKMGGGSVDPATGEFNFAVQEGYVIRKGKIAEPVRGATLIGKGHQVLPAISMVGDDLELAAGMCGAASGWVPTTVGQPTLKIDSILVGGR